MKKSNDTATPAGSLTKPYENLTEDNAKAAIIESRGDIFIASQLLSVSAVRLHRAIQVSEVLQATVAATRESAKKTKGMLDAAQVEESIQSRLAIYRVVGLDALHDLATMPIDANSAQNQVKLAAAARLAGPTEGSVAGGDLAETLRSLNQEYQAQAPRLRVTRERLTVETLPAREERIVGQGSPD